MEANLTPGMRKGSSYFPKACEMNTRLTYGNIAHLVIQGVLKRLRCQKKCGCISRVKGSI